MQLYGEGCWVLMPGAEAGNEIFNVINEVCCQQKSVVISNVGNGMRLGKLISHFQVTSSTAKRCNA